MCEADAIGFIPWFPLATGDLAGSSSVLGAVADRHRATPAQLALAWLFHRSPVMLPIPGTASRQHLDENARAALIDLSEREMLMLRSDLPRDAWEQ